MVLRSPITRTNKGIEFRSPFAKNVETRSFYPYISKALTSGFFNNLEMNPTVDTCISKICNTISILPINLYLRTKRGVQQAWWENLDHILKDPAVEETATLFYKTIVRSMLAFGNAYLFKGYTPDGQLAYLQIIDPLKVLFDRDGFGRKIFTIDGITYTEDQILHIPYFGEGYNGDLGKSPLQVHSSLIQQNNYIREYISLYFHQGIGSRLLVTLGDEFKPGKGQLEDIIQQFNEFYLNFVAGNENAGMPLITPPGTSIAKLDMGNNTQAEVEALLAASDAAICRIFNIPAEIIMSGENKYNSLEQKNADYLQSCIQPLANHIAQCLMRLIPEENKGLMYVAFSYDDLLETDIEKKQSRLMSAYHGGTITLNEYRAAMHLPSVQNEIEGNTRWIPANLIPATEDNINAMLAKSKLALQEYKDKDSVQSIEDKFANHNGFGMDKNV